MKRLESNMAARSIASLSISFGLVNIPVRLYSATESAAAVKFNMLRSDGSRLKQQYVAETDGKVVPRADMVKGYEFEKDHFVMFSPDELKALEEGSSPNIEIVSFIPEKTVDPLYYDKPYLLAPDKRGGKPYRLLQEALRSTGKCALAKWAWKAKQYVVQIRATEDGLVLQQLLYAEEVRSLKDLNIEAATVSPAELQLALQLVNQSSEDSYQPTLFRDEEKERVLAAIDAKIAGKQVVASARGEDVSSGGQVIDLMDALKASLGGASRAKATVATPKLKAPAAASANNVTAIGDAKVRKPVKRAPKAAEPVAAPAPAPIAARGRTKK
jgi:DNA end-binding protein Ku